MLAALVVFGILAMHTLAGGGHHTTHLDTALASSASSPDVADNHGWYETDSHAVAGAERSVLSADAPSAHPAACSVAGCAAGLSGVVCLALLMGVALAVMARRIAVWTASPRRANLMVSPTAEHSLAVRALSPSQLGISRT